jgi:hypothetical protein
MKKILVAILLGLIYFGCSKEEASIAGPGKIDTLIVIHRDTVYRKDSLIVNHRDTVIINKRDTLILNKKDTILISNKDTLIVKDSAYTWSSVIEKINGASYAIGLRDNTKSNFILIGSGSSINDSVICTNAHVALALFKQYIVYKQLGLDVTPVAIKNGSFSLGTDVITLNISSIHKDYDDATVFTSDVAIFFTGTKLKDKIMLASQQELESLKSGENIGTLGYPGETSSRIEKQVIATFKDGVISAQNTFNTLNAVTPKNAYIIQHNFNTTGGTSGSPIFNTHGNLISLNNSGAGTWVWDDNSGDFKFIGQGSIGYSIRVDILDEVLSKNKGKLDTISTYYIPKMYKFVSGQYVSNSDGTQPVLLGNTVANTQAAANLLFKQSPSKIYTDGSIEYTDEAAYTITFLKDTNVDNIWAALISGSLYDVYLPSFKDILGTTIGSSRSYILDTYGSNYNIGYSLDSTSLYYSYPAQGIAFGFKINESDWDTDLIQIAQPNTLAKKAVSNIVINREKQLQYYIENIRNTKSIITKTKAANFSLKKEFQ